MRGESKFSRARTKEVFATSFREKGHSKMPQRNEPSQVIRCRVIVHGRVQGVAFRASTQAQAHAAGVQGWVRNLPDGSVEAVLEGPAAAVHRTIEFCRHGPALAHVERIEIFDEAPSGLHGFPITR